MRVVYNAVVAALLVGAALGVAWALRPTSMDVWPHYTPTVAPYDTMTWTPEPPYPVHMP